MVNKKVLLVCRILTTVHLMVASFRMIDLRNKMSYWMVTTNKGTVDKTIANMEF